MDDFSPASICNLAELASLTREELISRLLTFQGKFRLDFTPSYLEQKTTDQLRHILVAACKHAVGGHAPPRRPPRIGSNDCSS